jgi:hypothetical protein
LSAGRSRETPEDAIEDLAVQIAESEGKEAEEATYLNRLTFEPTADGYRLRRPGIELEVEHLKRGSGGELRGEVLARSWIPGGRTGPGDVLAVDHLNLTSARTRKSFALYLKERSRLNGFDWIGLLETFGQRVIAAERQGEPPVLLSEVPEPKADRILDIEGFPLLSRHPSILFGDGGTAKSMLALWLAGKLAQRGTKVAIFDWELDQGEHRLRLGRLFPGDLPPVHYVRCSRPLVYEAERLRRAVKDRRLEYAFFDSIGYATDGAPEAAEAAIRYQQALRSLGEGLGSTHIAHITKAFEGGDLKPFGSVFWHNSARATWNVKLASGEAGDDVIHVALHNRKSNTTGRQRSVGYEIGFAPGLIRVRRVDLAGVADLAVDLSVAERVRMALRYRTMDRESLAVELEDVEPDTLRKTVNRMKKSGKLLEFPDRGLVLAERERT